MDSETPIQTIEHDENSNAHSTGLSTKGGRMTINIPTTYPDKPTSKTTLSQPTTPSPIKTSKSLSRSTTPSHDRHQSPTLQTRRSYSNLAVNRPQIRRVSSNLNPASPTAELKPQDMTGFRTSVTPGSIARDYFKEELATHENSQSEVLVLVHDSCYGHRFSRPRTSKAALSTIVERPERIHATLLGASIAYVRLGERYTASKYGPSLQHNTATRPEHPFTLKRTTRSIPLNHDAVTHIHGQKWMEELQIMCDTAEAKLAMNGKELSRPIGYGKDESGNALPKLHEGDLYLCSESLAALQGCLGGVCDAVDAVFQSGKTKRAFVCIRPPGHHCSSDFPSGFCWLNNVHVGVSYAAMNYGLTHAAIFDFDLHHGDGSQTIAWNHNRDAQSLPKHAAAHKKTAIGYYSLHDINSYPCEWGDEEKVRNASLCLQNAHGQSIWNVHLEPWTSLEHFWQLYENKYTILIEKARVFLRHHTENLRSNGILPRAAIFISAGFDASQWEGAGMQRHNVNVPTEFYARFTQDVSRLAVELDLGVDGRIISVLEGGYSDRALTSGVLSHLCGLTKGADMGSGIATSDEFATPTTNTPNESEWWQVNALEAIESMVLGHTSLPPPSKRQDKTSTHYSSPTHASTARMTEQARERRSLSIQFENHLSHELPSDEPPPDVDWVTASYELSRILIPNDRQTLSCRHDELNAEATRVRRERQSAVGLPASKEESMHLRTRKTRVAGSDGIRASSRTTNRRTTIAAVSDLPDPTMVEPVTLDRPRRRSSAASSILSNFHDMKIDDSHRYVSENVPDRILKGSSTTEQIAKSSPARKTKAVPIKKAASRASSPVKKKDAVKKPRSSSSKDRANTVKSRSDDSHSRPASSSRRSSPNAHHIVDGMDDLTNSMKKVSIKLNLPTPEQYEANRIKAEEDKLKKPRAPRKPPIPRAVRTKPPATSKRASSPPHPVKNQEVTMMDEVPHRGSTPSSKGVAALVQPTNQQMQPLMLTSTSQVTSDKIPLATQAIKLDSQVSVAHDESNFDPAQGFEEAVSRETQMNSLNDTKITSAHSSTLEQISFTSDTQLTEQPECTSPPSGLGVVQRTKADLPVFTSSSPIPFSRREE